MKDEEPQGGGSGLVRHGKGIIGVMVCAALFYGYRTYCADMEGDLPEPEVKVTSSKSGVRLVMEGTLPAELDVATLGKVAQATCRRHNCEGFRNVSISWHLAGDKPGGDAWASSVRNGTDAGMKTEVLRPRRKLP